MNRRQVVLLKKLIVENNYRPIKYYSKILRVSEKTISSDLDHIGAEVAPFHVSIDRKQGYGVKLQFNDEQLDQINSLINTLDDVLEENDIVQRRNQILLNMLIHTNTYISIQSLSDKYQVSRTSIINDLSIIQGKLNKYHLKLSKSLKGTKIVGNEINIRNALVSFIQELGKFNPSYITKYQNVRRHEIQVDMFSSFISRESITFIERLLNKLENKLKIVIYEPYYTNLLTHLAIMVNRIQQGNNLEENNDPNQRHIVTDKKLHEYTEYLIKELEKKFGINICNEEEIYIYKYLSSTGLNFVNQNVQSAVKNPEMLPIYFTKDLLETVAEMMNVSFTKLPGLYERLFLHVKPMLNRHKYAIQITNPLLNEFQKEFKEKFCIMKVASFLVCKKHQMSAIGDHEIAYLLSYFISSEEKMTDDIKLKTVVICHSGYGTSQLLATRLEKTFANIEVVEIIASKFINDLQLENIDLIISTVLLEIDIPYLIVSAFLSDVDKENIQNYINKKIGKKGTNNFLNNVKSLSNYKEYEINDLNMSDCFEKENLLQMKDNVYFYFQKNFANTVVKKYIMRVNGNKKTIFNFYYKSNLQLGDMVRSIIKTAEFKGD